MSAARDKNRTIQTFLNADNQPMIRKCGNCKFWMPSVKMDNEAEDIDASIIDIDNLDKTKNIPGCCTAKRLLFSLTMEPSRYFLTKKLDLCEGHEFKNEAYLEAVNAEKVIQADILRPKWQKP